MSAGEGVQNRSLKPALGRPPQTATPLSLSFTELKAICTMRINNTVFVHGRNVGLSDIGSTYDGPYEMYTLPIRQLRPGYLCADDRKGPWEWTFVGIMGAIGLFMLCGGIFMIFAAFGFFPDRESGWWNIGIPGIVCLILGAWLTLSAFSATLGFTRLVIEQKRIALEEVTLGRAKCIGECMISSDDYLMCHLREDAEQDFYSVSLELVLPELKKSITLFLNGVAFKQALGRSPEDALNRGLNLAAERAFDKAREIKDFLNIRVQY